jgi:hypothetical protein
MAARRTGPTAAAKATFAAHPLRMELLGIGAMNSPRFAPAGLLVHHAAGDVMIDGGPGAEPAQPVRAWLVTDLRAELISGLRAMARARGLIPAVGPYTAPGLLVTPLPVEHTNHPTWGYRLEHGCRVAVWAPEFQVFPAWAADADLMFADAAGWARPIRFRGGVGGHAAALETAEQARAHGVRRLIFAHIGRRPCAPSTPASGRRTARWAAKAPPTRCDSHARRGARRGDAVPVPDRAGGPDAGAGNRVRVT